MGNNGNLVIVSGGGGGGGGDDDLSELLCSLSLAELRHFLLTSPSEAKRVRLPLQDEAEWPIGGQELRIGIITALQISDRCKHAFAEFEVA